MLKNQQNNNPQININENINNNYTIDNDIVNTNSHPIELNSLTTSYYFSSNVLSSGISLEQLRLYTKYPMKYNRQIRKLSREAYNSNGQYGNCIDYMTDIPTLDFITVCNENTPINQKKRKLFNFFLKKINHKLTSRDILRHSFIDGFYVGILRNTKANNKNINPTQGTIDSMEEIEGLSFNDNLMIQPLNLDYCKIVGFQNNVQIAAFNLQYFDQFKHGGLLKEIKNYPSDFAKAYLEYKKDGSKQWFILSPETTIVLKFRSNINEPYGRPVGLSALFDIRFAEDYANSQIETINDLASSIYYLILPEGEKKGQCSLNKEQQKNIISAFEGAVTVSSNNNGKTKVSKLSLAPGTQLARMPKDSSLLKDTLNEENIKKISTALGFASSALNASSQGGASYSSLQVNIDLVMSQIFSLVEQIAFEYTRVLNNLINSKGKEIVEIKYLRTSILNQQRNYEIALNMYTNCGGTITHVIASAGFDVDSYITVKQMEKENGYDELFEPNLTSYTATSDDKGGRPEDKNSKNDNTARSKDSGANKMKRPSNSKK